MSLLAIVTITSGTLYGVSRWLSIVALKRDIDGCQGGHNTVFCTKYTRALIDVKVKSAFLSLQLMNELLFQAENINIVSTVQYCLFSSNQKLVCSLQFRKQNSLTPQSSTEWNNSKLDINHLLLLHNFLNTKWYFNIGYFCTEKTEMLGADNRRKPLLHAANIKTPHSDILIPIGFYFVCNLLRVVKKMHTLVPSTNVSKALSQQFTDLKNGIWNYMKKYETLCKGCTYACCWLSYLMAFLRSSGRM